MPDDKKIKLAFFKFSACSGCEQVLLNAARELLNLANVAIDVLYWKEATSRDAPGPYDVAVVEGAITEPEQVERIKHVRATSKTLVAMGACATTGGKVALKNWSPLRELVKRTYSEPDWISTLQFATGLDLYVPVDYYIKGCGPDEGWSLQALAALALGRTPELPAWPVCLECKLKGNVCILVAKDVWCMGPVTSAGCGAACPSVDRDCYTCFGPSDAPNTGALARLFEHHGVSGREILRKFRHVNSNAEPFRKEAEHYAEDKTYQG